MYSVFKEQKLELSDKSKESLLLFLDRLIKQADANVSLYSRAYAVGPDRISGELQPSEFLNLKEAAICALQTKSVLTELRSVIADA